MQLQIIETMESSKTCVRTCNVMRSSGHLQSNFQVVSKTRDLQVQMLHSSQPVAFARSEINMLSLLTKLCSTPP